jgi:hypothetical protein
MVYNENRYLPIWCRYYGGLLGREKCFIIDHGSDDGSIEVCTGFNVIRLPRSVHDDQRRTEFVSGLASDLLNYFDKILYVDVDEIVVPDPSKYADLRQYCDEPAKGAISAFGFEIQHVVGAEGNIDINQDITGQREWMWFTSAMCKTVLTSEPIQWTPGFHSSNFDTKFDDLYLFHLRNFDLNLGLERLRRTRSLIWSSEAVGKHQRITDEKYVEFVRNKSRMRRESVFYADAEQEPLKSLTQSVLNSQGPYHPGWQRINLGIYSDVLYKIPGSFVGKF